MKGVSRKKIHFENSLHPQIINGRPFVSKHDSPTVEFPNIHIMVKSCVNSHTC